MKVVATLRPALKSVKPIFKLEFDYLSDQYTCSRSSKCVDNYFEGMLQLIGLINKNFLAVFN